MFVLKDPRISRFADLIIETLEHAGVRVVPLIALRNPLDVISSIDKRGLYLPEDHTDADSALVWLRHMLDADWRTRSHPRVIVSYESIMKDWRAQLRKIAHTGMVEFLYGPDEIATLVEEFITPKQRNFASSAVDVIHNPMLRGWISDAYSALRILEQESASKNALSQLDEIRSSFNSASPLIFGLLDSAKAFSNDRLSRNLAEAEHVSQKREAETTQLITVLEAAEVDHKQRIESLQTEIAAVKSTLIARDASLVELTRQVGDASSALRHQEQIALHLSNDVQQHQAKSADLARSLSEKEEELQARLAQANAANEAVQQRDQSLRNLEAEKQVLQERIADLQKLVDDKLVALDAATEQTSKAEQSIRDREEVIAQLQSQRVQLETRLSALGKVLEGKEARIAAELERTAKFEASLRDSATEIAHLSQQRTMLQSEKNGLEIEVSKLTAARDTIDIQASEKERIIQELTSLVESRAIALGAAEMQPRETLQVADKRRVHAANLNDELERQLREADSRIAELEHQLRQTIECWKSERDDLTSTHRDEIVSAQKLIARVRQETDVIHDTYRNSTSWRLTKPVRAIKRFRLSIGGLVGAVPVALRHGGGVMPSAQKAMRIFRAEGVSGIRRRIEIVRFRSDASRRYELPTVSSHSANSPNVDFSTQPTLTESCGVPTEVTRTPSHTLSLFEDAVTEQKLKILDEQLPLETQAVIWKRSDAASPAGNQNFHERLLGYATQYPAGLIVSFTHDNYQNVVGGLQICAQSEEKAFREDGFTYLCLHPYQPLPMLAPNCAPETFMFQAIINGVDVGAVSARTLIEALAAASTNRGRCAFIVHSLLGHSPEILELIAKAMPHAIPIFWIHDMFAICPNYALLRNGISFCGAPSISSNSCNICAFGADRARHQWRVKNLFSAIPFRIISPSEAASEFWGAAVDFEHQDILVAPHISLVEEGNVPAITPRDSSTAVRIAFLGYPGIHKGWPFFKQLATQFRGDNRYEFFHFGQDNSMSKNITFERVITSTDDRQAMIRLMRSRDIDIAFLWSTCFETFSFTAHEAILSGAIILTTETSGNIAALVRRTGLGYIIKSDAEVFLAFENGSLGAAVKEQRSARRSKFTADFSSMSRRFVS